MNDNSPQRIEEEKAPDNQDEVPGQGGEDGAGTPPGSTHGPAGISVGRLQVDHASEKLQEIHSQKSIQD